MWNIMKALRYQIKRDNYSIIILILAFLIPVMSLLLDDSGVELSEMTGSMYVSGYVGEMYAFVLIAIVLLTTRITGWDYNDKTINYEIMTGHSKKEVFGARAILSILANILVYGIMMVLPMIVFTIMNGWGKSLLLKNAVIRYILMIFPIFRITCIFVLLTVIVANCYIALVIGYALLEGTIIFAMIMEEMLDKTFTIQFAATNMEKMLSFPSYKTQFIDGKDVMVFKSAVSGSLSGGTIIASLIFGMAALTIGNIYFKQHDM